jgi:2-(1,2-epoxy-1,2-dihydrophenyl)acetyl-CoA isomerase
VDSDEALRLGLLDEIVPDGTLDEVTLKLARRLARAPQLAMRTAKRQLAMQAGGANLSEMLDAETAGIVACVGDDDFAEGVTAFLEKRAAVFPSAR